MLCQPVHPESNINHFRPFSVLDSALWFFNKTHRGLRRSWKNFCFLTRVSYSQPSQFDKLAYSRFWGVLCQPVHPESNINHFRPFSVLDSALWFFNKTHRGLRRSWKNFCFLTRVSYSQPSQFDKLAYSRFWGVLCQPLHPKIQYTTFWLF